jgi:hypothetical protein
MPNMKAGAYVPKGTPPPTPTPRAMRSDIALRVARLGLVALAGLGAFAGVYVLFHHLTTDPLADARAYYDAARRLNAGEPLYPPGIDPSSNRIYLYPPLLAIILRPLALLPYLQFALVWEALVVVSFTLLLRRLGAGFWTFVALGLLGLPVAWCLAIAQAHLPLTLLLAIGQPWSIALASNLKLFPALAALWWLGRRDHQAVGAFAGWMMVLALAQLILAPGDSLSFFPSVGLAQLGEVRNISPFVISPWLWGVGVAAGIVAAIVLAPTRWGWPTAVALATLASPRLLVYMLTGLLAAVRDPSTRWTRDSGNQLEVVDVAEAYARSAR